MFNASVLISIVLITDLVNSRLKFNHVSIIFSSLIFFSTSLSLSGKIVFELNGKKLQGSNGLFGLFSGN